MLVIALEDLVYAETQLDSALASLGDEVWLPYLGWFEWLEC